MSEKESEALKQQKLFAGTVLALLSALFYSIYSLLAKWTQQQGINFYQISFFTFFISWIVLAPYLLRKGVRELKTQQFPWLLFRSVFGLAIIYFFVISLQTIPLVDAVMLNNSAPLFIPFIAYFILKIPINKKLFAPIAIGLIGLGLILRPDKQLFNVGGIWGIMSAITMAFSWVAVRKLTYTEPVTKIIFYFLSIATVLTAIPLISTWQSLSFSAWLYLIVIGLSYLICTVTFVIAAKLISITMVSILYYAVVVFTVLLNWMIFHLFPNLVTICGIILVIGGGVVSLWIEGKKIK